METSAKTVNTLKRKLDVSSENVERRDARLQAASQTPLNEAQRDLVLAIRRVDLAKVRTRLREQVDLDFIDEEGHSPLFLAANNDDSPENASIVEALMQALRANPKTWAAYTAKNEWGKFIFQATNTTISATEVSTDEDPSEATACLTLKTLLKHLVEYSEENFKIREEARAFKTSYLEYVDEAGDTPLLLAYSAIELHTRTLDTVLLEAGASIKATNLKGENALILAAYPRFYVDIVHKVRPPCSVLETLLKRIESDLVYLEECRQKRYFSKALIECVEHQFRNPEVDDSNSLYNIRLLSKFIGQEELLAIRDDQGNSLLHQCVNLFKFETLKFFVARGLSLEDKNKAGLTPLELANTAALLPTPDEPFDAAEIEEIMQIRINICQFLDQQQLALIQQRLVLVQQQFVRAQQLLIATTSNAAGPALGAGTAESTSGKEAPTPPSIIISGNNPRSNASVTDSSLASVKGTKP